MAEDKATCPYCKKEFLVEEYGYGLRCPLCKGKIDIFPEPKYYIETPFGTMGVGPCVE